MPNKAPMELSLNDDFIGTIVTYQYATPWAEGMFEPANETQHARLIAACEFLIWVETSEDRGSVEADDKAYFAELARRGVTEADVDTLTKGRWKIMLKDGQPYSISWPQFDKEGFITWRW